MKKQSTIIIISFIVFGFLFSGTSMADDEWNLSDYSGKYHKSREKSSLNRAIQRGVFLKALSKSTNIPQNELKEMLKSQSPTALLEKKGCSLETFKDTLQKSYEEVLQNLSTDNLISQKQIKRLMERNTKRIERRLTLMTIIEKGIQNGTITMEQAQKLFHFGKEY